MGGRVSHSLRDLCLMIPGFIRYGFETVAIIH